MNYPPLKDVGTLVETISNLMSREKKLGDQYLMIKQGKKLDSDRYKISSISEQPEKECSMNGSGIRSQPLPPKTISSEYVSLKSINDLPQVHRTGGYPHTHPKHEIAESIGHIAEGLFDLGSKTVNTASVAIATIQKQYEVHRHAAVDHPLQSHHAFEQNKDYSIDYRPDTSERSKSGLNKSFQEYRPYIPESSKQNTIDIAKQSSDSTDDQDSYAEGESIEGLDDSVEKRSTLSTEKSPHALASMLEKSVDTLMKHFKDRLSTNADTNAGSETEDPISQLHSSSIIPDQIWDAMADIDLVRKELLSQGAIASIDFSNSSLKSSGNSREKRGSKPRKAEKRLSWQL